MIVRCEQCATRFQLDDARVPSTGIRVRCSSCKHAFFLEPAGASADDAIHGAASAAADTAVAAPETTQDLPPETAIGETTASFLSFADAAPCAAQENGESESESDWEFNREEPEDDPDPAAAILGREAPEGTPPVRASDADSNFFGSVDDLDSLSAEVDAAVDRATIVAALPLAAGGPESAGAEELGDPEHWNLLGGADAGPAGGALAAADGLPMQGDSSDRVPPAQEASRSARAARDVEFYESPIPKRSFPKLPAWAARSGRAVGWALVVGLFGWGVYAGTVGQGLAPSRDSTEFASAGFRAAAIDAHWLDTARAGTLYVVAGRLQNTTRVARAPGRELSVRLFAEGDPNSGFATKPLIQPLAEPELRTRPVAELRGAADRAAERFAVTAVPPGASVPFRAIFHAVPDRATHWMLEAKVSTPPDAGQRD